MSDNYIVALKSTATFVNIQTGEPMYRVDGTIHPDISPRGYVTLFRHVIVKNVRLGSYYFPFESDVMCRAFLDCIRWYNPLRRSYSVSALIRMVPNADDDWPGDTAPEIVAVLVDAHKQVYVNDLCDISPRLILQ